VFILKKQDWCTSVQKDLCQNVLYHVGNCVSLCQYGEGFLLMNPGCHRLYKGQCPHPNVHVHVWTFNHPRQKGWISHIPVNFYLTLHAFQYICIYYMGQCLCLTSYGVVEN
jgi:hypothetical protein